MDNQLISENLTEQILQYIKNSLQAHDADLAEELKSNSKRQATMAFVLKLEAIGTEVIPKLRVRIPRQALAVETMFSKQRMLF